MCHTFVCNRGMTAKSQDLELSMCNDQLRKEIIHKSLECVNFLIDYWKIILDAEYFIKSPYSSVKHRKLSQTSLGIFLVVLTMTILLHPLFYLI